MESEKVIQKYYERAKPIQIDGAIHKLLDEYLIANRDAYYSKAELANSLLRKVLETSGDVA